MDQSTLKWINLGSAIFASIAAALWFYSAVVRVKINESPDDSGFISSSISDGKGNDLLGSLKRANLWNALAASFAGFAALLQAVSAWFSA